MKLLTHNMLSSNIKGVTAGYLLVIDSQTIATIEVHINPSFLRHISPKLDFSALVAVIKTLGFPNFRKLLSGRRFMVTKGIPNMLLHEDEV
ncbi:hypothetical protein Droror1_Dr00000374 [Drosera rotundifolia]